MKYKQRIYLVTILLDLPVQSPKILKCMENEESSVDEGHWVQKQNNCWARLGITPYKEMLAGEKKQNEN